MNLKKEILTALFLLLCMRAFCTDFYISPSGNDGTGTGSIGAPWASLHKAASVVTTSGDNINVIAGSYTDNTQSNLSVGVNIIGAGSGTTTITTSYAGASYTQAYLMVSSGTEGTNGNQTISGITFDGNSLTGDRCIYVHCRSNVTIHDCNFRHFIAAAISFRGSAGGFSTQPSIYAYNDKFYNDSIYDCAGTHATYGGAILIGGTDSLQIYNCSLVDTGRTQGNNGNIIGGVEGHNRGLKYYNNVSWKPLNDNGNNYNAHLEFWGTEGGMEIYGNTFNGGGYMIDEGNGSAYVNFLNPKYNYNWNVHDNTFQQSAQTSSATGNGSVAVSNEGNYSKCFFVNNHVKNLSNGVYVILGYWNNSTTDSNTIAKNLFENMGCSDGLGNALGIINIENYQNSFHAHNDTISNTLIYNNTFINRGSPGLARSAITFLNDSVGSVITKTQVYDNIIDSTTGSWGFLTFFESQTTVTAANIDTVFSYNNIVFGNSNSNAPFYRSGRTTSNAKYSAVGTINSNPLLGTDYHLLFSSPAIGAGLNVGYGLDIGAFPYISTVQGNIKLYGNWKIKNLLP